MSGCLVVPNVRIILLDRDLEVLDVIRSSNLMVKIGRRALRDLVGYPQLTPGVNASPDYIALGDSGSATVDGQTTLGNDVFRKQISRKTAIDDQTVQFQLSVDAGEANGPGTQPLREVGLFNQSSGGTMWARATHMLINKTSAISIVYQWQLFFTAV